jgi:hypothetical protein
MQLSLSPEQFERMLKLAYLGEIVANDWTPDAEQADEQRGMTDLLYDLCARADGTPSARLVEFDKASGEWIPSAALKEEMDRIIGDYDNDVFWDELTARLARRDMVAEYGEEALSGMTESYRKQAENPLADYYWAEVRENGIDRLFVREDIPGRARRRQGRDRLPKRERQAGQDDGSEA